MRGISSVLRTGFFARKSQAVNVSLVSEEAGRFVYKHQMTKAMFKEGSFVSDGACHTLRFTCQPPFS